MAPARQVSGPGAAPRGRRTLACLAALAALALLVLPALARPADAAAQPLTTGIGGIEDYSPQTLHNVRRTGSTMARIPVGWQWVAPKSLPASWDPRNPADPHYNWSWLDREVNAVAAAGLTPFLLLEGAPRWAQRCSAPAGLMLVEVCDPSPAALADFASAAAQRYSGAFGGLPRVKYWQGLNEPNLSLFFYPQFSTGGKPLSAGLYRALIDAFYGAVKGVDPSNLVVAAGLGPIARKGWTIGPMQFTRELLCMRGSKKFRPAKRGCEGGVHFDVFDIHPYTTGGPTHTGGPDDVELGDMKRLQRLIKAADRAGHIQGTVKRTKIWVGEFSWDTRPPDPGGLKMRIAVRWVAEALHTAWSAGVDNFIWYGLRDEERSGNTPFSETTESGLFFRSASAASDRPKPILRAYRFPFVAYPRKKGLRVWGRTPTGGRGKVRIQVKRGKKWRTVKTVKASKAGIFRGRAGTRYGRNERGSARAVFRSQRSPGFSMKPVRDFYQRPFG